MKKSICVLLILSSAFFGFSIRKGKYYTNQGKISFYSSAPIENIEAINNKVVSIIDTDQGTLAFSLMIKDFNFDKSLMQEHFNENYMDSDKYPKSTFKGKIVNASEVNFDVAGIYNTVIEGELMIHNVTKSVKANGTIQIKDGKVIAKAKFPIRVKDYNIEIPTIVFQNIAEVVEVTVDLAYDPYNK